MKKKFVLALLTVFATGAAASYANAQDAVNPNASATPAPKADSKARKKKKKHKVAKASDAQKSNVEVPTGEGVGDGARIKTSDKAGGTGAAETTIQNTNPNTESNSTTNPPKSGSIDDEITNKKLRALTGSLSKFSFQSALTYNGGSLHKPFAPDRPSLSAGDVNPQPVSVAGTISAKYRLDEHDNINVGTGLNWVNPFHGNPPNKNTAYDHLEVADPYIAFSRLFKAWGIQNVFNTQLAYYTDKVAKDGKDQFESLIEHTLLYGIGKTSAEVGLDFDWTHEFHYANTGDVVDSLDVFPFFEYELTKKFSFRTVYWGLRYYNLQGSVMTFHHQNVAQSAGIGISVTRDIYLYPNVQWNWDGAARWRKTNIALATNINLF